MDANGNGVRDAKANNNINPARDANGNITLRNMPPVRNVHTIARAASFTAGIGPTQVVNNPYTKRPGTPPANNQRGALQEIPPPPADSETNIPDNDGD